jgi:hypothetical protein
VRAGARYASLSTYNSANATPTAAFQTAVRIVVVYGNPAGGTTPVALGLTTANVSVTVTFATVSTEMDVAITGYQLPTYFGSQTLNGKPTTAFQFVDVFGPHNEDMMPGKKYRSGRRGNAIIEATLTLTLFLTVLFSIYDFGWVLFFHPTLVHQARTAAGFAAVKPWLHDFWISGARRLF